MPDTSAIPQGRVQPLRSFTAQVRRGEKSIKGTAFAVQHEPPLLVTCRHVVKAVADKCEVGAEVHIYFPSIRDNDNKLFTAKVYQLPEGGEDDVALLKLDAERFPSGVEVAVLASGADSENNEFQSYGFLKLAKFNGNRADGRILGHVDKPVDEILHADPLQLKSQQLDRGMSGAPVLDLERNLVIGIIAETWDSKRRFVHRDTGYAVDSIVLSLESFNLPMYKHYRLPLMPRHIVVAESALEKASEVAPNLNFLAPMFRPTEPPILTEWAGRKDLLGGLDQDYVDKIHITGLIGFGGEGKSSIAYRWLVNHLLDEARGLPKANAVFWWSFYENRSFEQLIEQLMNYLYGADATQRLRGTAGRVEAIGAMATKEDKRIVLVLDGFEVMQTQDGDKFGDITNKDLYRLIELFTQEGHESYCLITSRVSLFEFMEDSAYRERPVTSLTPEDGRDLLRKLGVDGDDDQLDPIVRDWEGHALTVSLVGSYLRERGIAIEKYTKDIFPDVEAYEDEVPRYRQVRRILERYDENLTEADKAFLKLFSVFRLPVPESAFERVFRADTGSTLNTDLHGLDDAQFETLITHLVERRLIRKAKDKGAITYNAHPLVQRHYRKALEGEHKNTDVQPIHKAVADHYQKTSHRPSRRPTLDDLKPYIEVVHHLCHAEAYDEGFDVFLDTMNRQNLIVHKLSAYETTLSLLLEFFPESDTIQEPQVSNPNAQRFILNGVGFCLQQLGQLRESAPFYERKNKIALDMGDHRNASSGYQNLAELYLQLGELAQMQDSAEQALSEARKVVDRTRRKQMERSSFVPVAWAKHLRGQNKEASDDFKTAERLEIELYSEQGIEYLVSLRGIWHAEHLRRIEEADTARSVTEANLAICQREGWKDDWSRCHHVLGDLEADAENHQEAETHYDQALAIAGQIEKVDVKIEAWLARGRWLAKQGESEKALRDLETALGMALKGEYRLYEADIRVAMAWAYKAQGDTQAMGREAGQALAMSVEMGYHWGQVDAREVLES